MIVAEALVEITGAGRGFTGSPGTRLGRHIAGLAGMSQALGVSPAGIEAFMGKASRARNQVIHADAGTPASYYRLKGTTAELSEMVDDLDLVIRLTVRHLLTGSVT